MAQPLSPSSSFVAGLNPRLSQSGSIPLIGTPPGSSMTNSYQLHHSNGGIVQSPSGQSVQDIEAQIRLQQEQLLAQQALLEQQQALLRQQQEQMALRQRQIEAERQRLLNEQEAQLQLQAGSPLVAYPNANANLAQLQQLALLNQQHQQATANGGAHPNGAPATLVNQQQASFTPQQQPQESTVLFGFSNPALNLSGSVGAMQLNPGSDSAPVGAEEEPLPPPSDDEAPSSYFGNDMDFDPLASPHEIEDIPLPPDDNISISTASTVQTMSLSALSDTPVGSLSGSTADMRLAAQTAPIVMRSASPSPLVSSISTDNLRASSPSTPMLSPTSSASFAVPMSSSAPVTGHMALSMSAPGGRPASPSSSLAHSGEMKRDEEGGFIRPDDLTMFVPIVPIKKDYSALNAIKDKAIDDLVMFSKNFQIMIKGGTLQKLIERLTFESTTDNDYIDTFLLTYRTFIAPNDLLEQLLDRYRTGTAEINPEGVSEIEASNAEKKQKIIRIRVGNVLKRWLSDHYHDYHDPALLARVEAGIADIQEPQLQAMLRKTIQEQQLQKNKIRDLMFSKEKPTPLIPKGPTFDDWDIVEVARQLCLYEQTIYQAIHPKEALNQNWNKHKDKAPNLLKMIAFFNRMSKWVSTQVCLRENFKERVKLIIKFMQLTVHLRQYNNFDCMQAVLSGLNNSSVFRMKASWAKIQKEKFYTQWRQMASEITDTTNNSANYRQAVSHADPPIIPYLGVYLTDLTFTEDGNSNYLKVQDGREDIVNFEKMRRVAVLIKDICTYQQTPYNFEKVSVIYDFFAGELPFEDDNSLFRRSRALEPPDTNNPGQVITPKKPKKSLSFRRISLGVFHSKDSDGEASPSSSPKDKKKKEKKDK
jgi:hypothetical protein